MKPPFTSYEQFITYIKTLPNGYYIDVLRKTVEQLHKRKLFPKNTICDLVARMEEELNAESASD